jgi:dihydrofolate synthase/folylpolyglutamate synthase
MSIDSDQVLEQILDRLTGYYPRAIDPNLERTFRLLRDLGNPHDALPPVIHIAGTNGKGSTLATIRAVLEAAGMSCHVMTSPHLVRFHERIVLAGREIETKELIAVLEETERRNAGRETTSFELITAAGFIAFSRHPADMTLLETGMGGRLDATNVVAKPIATIITVISHDHTQFLGTTLPAIAGEKAGIMKAGVPCIIGPQTPEGLRAGVMQVFEDRAAGIGAPLYRHGYEWSYEPTQTGFILHTGTDIIDLPRPVLPGAHQIGNAATAIMTLMTVQEALPKPVTGVALDQGLRSIRWPGRLQRLTQGELAEVLPGGWELWLDGGHNDSGGQILSDQAKLWAAQDGKPLTLILGMLNTKDPRSFVTPLGAFAQNIFTLTIPGQPLSLSNDALASAIRDGFADVPVSPADTPLDAVRRALSCGPGPGRILITGSLYLAGEILKSTMRT